LITPSSGQFFGNNDVIAPARSLKDLGGRFGRADGLQIMSAVDAKAGNDAV
jgi:hypothetical protein